MPICNRPTCESRLENVPRLKYRVQRHVPAVAPAPDADALSIHIRQRLQIGHAVELIGKLLRSQPKMDRLLKYMSTPGRPSVIQCKDDIALLRHHLVPQARVASPRIRDHLRVRASVREH